MGLTEVATLILEVDDQGVWDQMENRAAAAAKRQEREFNKAAKSVINSWREFYSFLESGSPAVQRLSANFNVLKERVSLATASSGQLHGIITQLDAAVTRLTRNTAAISAMGNAIAAVGTGAIGPFMSAVTAVDDLQRAIRGLPTSVDIQVRLLQRRVNDPLPEWNQGAVDATVDRLRRDARRREDFTAERIEGAQGPGPTALTNEELEELRRRQANRQGGGGGGGGENAATRLFNQLQEIQRDELAFWQNRTDAVAESLASEEQMRKQLADGERQGRLAILDQTLSQERSIRDANTQNAVEQKRLETDDFLQREQNKRAAIAATADALASYSAALMQGGKAAQAAGRVVMAVEAVIAGVRAGMEIGEALAAAARYDFGAAALHTLSAVQFGIVAGTKASGAFGGGAGRSGGSRARDVGRATDFASPRSSGSIGAGDTVHMTIVLNAAGEVVDDTTYRKLGQAVREAQRRGYA